MSFNYGQGDRFYKLVPANNSESQDVIPTDGQKIQIVNMGISSSSSPDTVGCIVWDAEGDPEVLISSHSEIVHSNVNIEIIGNGVKKLRIHLSNDLSEDTYMGGFWEGEEHQ